MKNRQNDAYVPLDLDGITKDVRGAKPLDNISSWSEQRWHTGADRGAAMVYLDGRIRRFPILTAIGTAGFAIFATLTGSVLAASGSRLPWLSLTYLAVVAVGTVMITLVVVAEGKREWRAWQLRARLERFGRERLTGRWTDGRR